MLAGDWMNEQNHVYSNARNLDNHRINENRPTASSFAIHDNPVLIPQSDPWPYQPATRLSEDTVSQSLTQSNQFDSKNSTMNRKEWRNICDNPQAFLSSDSVLRQALPGALAAPTGWRSEFIRSSSSLSTDNATNAINSGTGFIESHEEYKTLNTSDGPPMIFSSTPETNRIINEKPPLPNVTSSRSFSEFHTKAVSDSSRQEQKTVLTKEQKVIIDNIENQQPPPLIMHKKLQNDVVTYNQNISVRYLQPPTPPPPGPIIIREIRPPPPPPQSPVQIRQRPPPPRTPPPIVFRERPPPVPPRPPSRVVERLLPPPPRPPRRVIVDCFGPCPPKPADVIIERWLPYRRTDRRQIFFEKIPAPYRPPQEPNLLIMHDQRHARVHKEFINQGVVRADPHSYLQRFGAELNSTDPQYHQIIDEAVHALPAPQPLPPTNNPPQYHPPHWNGYPMPPPSSSISTIWDRMKSASPAPQLPPYQPVPPYVPPPQYPYGNHSNAYPPYNNYAAHGNDMRTMTGVTSSWGGNYQGSPPPQYSYPTSYAPPRTIQVNSDGELHHVLSDLTNGHVPTPFRSY